VSNPKFTTWRKSRHSGGDSNCVEVAFAADVDGSVGVRDSKNRTGPLLEITSAEWNTFLRAIKANDLHLL
jgi:hypothetical protein